MPTGSLHGQRASMHDDGNTIGVFFRRVLFAVSRGPEYGAGRGVQHPS